LWFLRVINVIKRVIRIDTLQWFIGIYLAMRGMLMLVVPHRLSTHVFVPIKPYLPWLGTLQVLGGAALLAVAILLPRRWVVIIAHFLAGAALLQAGIGHFLAGTWTAVSGFGILGIGVAIAPFLPHLTRSERSGGGNFRSLDWFALLIAVRLGIEGILLLLGGSQFDTSLYDPVRLYLPFYGVAHLGGCLGLTAAYGYPRLSRFLFNLAHIAAGLVLWSWTIGLGFPTWNSVLYFGGLGTLLALLPWLSFHLRRLDPTALRTQLAVILVGLVTLPLLLAVAIVTLPQERALIDQALTSQRALATAFSRDIASYVGLHQSAVIALASQPNLANMSAAEQRSLLQAFSRAYPDMVVFTTYDADGNAIARSDDRLGSPIADLSLYEIVRRTKQPRVAIRIGRVIQQPLFMFAVPIQTAVGDFAGIGAGALRSAQVAEQLAQAGNDADLEAYLVDRDGRVIAHPNDVLVYDFADFSQRPPVQALLRQNHAFGGLQFWDGAAWQLAGYAQVPELGWGVVVERPMGTVLAAVIARRNRDFAILLLISTATLGIGSFIAQRLTKPLMALAYATGQLATGNRDAPLPKSTIREVAHLSMVFGTMRDRLTKRTVERDQAEAELRQTLKREQIAREEAETANRIKDEFLAVLSHELRSPLNPILGWVRLLRTRTFDEATTQRALETIERNAKLQTQLIEDLLDVSRILRGKMALNIAPVNLVPMIEAALETVQLAADSKQIQIHKKFNAQGDRVLGDPNRLQQVIWNLLSNAIKFTPVGGKVEIRLDRVDSMAQIQVQDNGNGISPAFLPHVFDYFRQADSKITRQYGGLGLGLAIVRHLTELHGGTVKADSLGEGQGATFTVQLPLLKSSLAADPKQKQLPAKVDLNGLTILVVDDDADIRDLVTFILQSRGAKVQVATSAADALRLLDQTLPDLLLSDIGMPTMDGYTLMKQIRRRSPEQGGTIPAIALTAYAGELNQKYALDAGFQQHIAKPVEPEILVNAIAILIQSQRQNELN
jgi:signal transduction histidine kinase/CheY-like chemotaxis protein